MSKKTQNLIGMAILGTIVVILQFFASGIKIGPFSITLTLVPIAIGAILYGPKCGAFLGFLFGAVVVYGAATGVDIGANVMFQYNAAATIFLCIVKSTVAGFVAGVLYKLFNKKGKNKIGIFVSGIACPIINTGLFALIVLTIFGNLVSEWAGGGKSIVTYLLFTVIGTNFLLELGINIVLTPVILRIVSIVKKES